ncbi:hypothetical protein LX32DRAFT_339300 [Colletotrichum zoysiae]|uniref:Cytochrome b5 heme-binding domain-containing protein n=1 Tax=Colletotrichum zoysiae TaxID=1216348 RepID=A0AAD9M976_9PEZI|nr:hypothetical protein LX32DRAFT_339300 [Colletotrichum zoysiae]
MRGMNPRTCQFSLYWKYDGWALEDPFIDVPLGVPAVVLCAMTTSDFWDVHVKKYGYSGLRWTWVCEGRLKTTNGENQMQPAKIMDQPYKYSRYDDLNQSMKAVAQKLRKRRLDLKRLRPWYAQEYALWSRTIYAETVLRSTLNTLARTLYGHSVRREYRANALIKELLMPHSRLSDLEAARPENARMSKMFYHAMGFLAQAALPVRTGTFKWKESRDNSVAQYPDRLRPVLRPDFAGDLALLDQIVMHGTARASAQRIKTLYDNVAPSHNRELCMSNARLAFRRWQVLGFVSAAVARDFEREWELLRRQMDQRPLDDARLDWSPITWQALSFYDGEPGHHISAFFHQGNQINQQSEGVDTDIPAGAIVRPAIPTAPSGPAAAPWIPYYSPGEVGDHQSLDSTIVWCCAWTGQEMAIYDVTDLLVDVPWNWAQRDDVTQPAAMHACRVAGHDIDQEWVDRFTRERPLGYVAALRKPEDIRINDGKEGRPLWVMAGEDVYDVTNVDLPPELQDLEAIFTGSSNEDPVAEAVHQGYHPDVIQAALRPYRIGWVQKAFQEFHRSHHVFTASEVKWHTTRETGIYIIIRGMVYDFTELIEQHPGGSSIIAQVAGTDATSDWDRFHDEPMTEFGINVHNKLESLKIGRVIEERMATTTTLSPTEICIRNFIYSKEKIAQDNPNDYILNLLDGLWGTDGTADMQKPNPSAGYLRLWESPWYIVAKMSRPPNELPYMSPNVLAKMDGRERPDGFNESWVSADCVVYNITSLVRYSTPTPILNKLKLRAGSCLDDKVAEDHDLITWLKSNCSHRAIGLLHTPKHGLYSANKLVVWKTSYRRTPASTPKAVPQAGGSTAAATPPAPFTVRPLYPLRKKRKKTKHVGAWYPYQKLPGAAFDGQVGEPMDESPDGPIDDPMDTSRVAARTALEQMGFPATLGRGAAGQKRKTGGW